jgi:hypothetical protein
MFVYCRPLAFSTAAEGFLRARWFVKEVTKEVKCPATVEHTRELVVAAETVIQELERFGSDVSKLIFDDLVDIPGPLRSDFLTARNLLSLGFDEAAVIYAGRGLEAVLRNIAHTHNIAMKDGTPAWEARFADILNRMQQLRVVATNEKLLDPGTINLLQFGRNARNQVAHPSQNTTEQKHREQAVLMAHKACELWSRCAVAGISFA